MNRDNENLKKEYDNFRKKVARVLRVIYKFRKGEELDVQYAKLTKLKKEAKKNIRHSNVSIDKLIREELISAESASSLFNACMVQYGHGL